MKNRTISLGLSAISVVSLLSAAARGAEPAVTIENVRVGFADRPAGGMFRVGAWTPVRVDLKAGPATFAGKVELTVPDDDGTDVVTRTAVTVPARQMSTVTLYARPGLGLATFRAVATDRDGTPLSKEVEAASATAIDPGKTVIATLGQPSGVDALPDLPAFAIPGSTQDSELRVVRLRVPDGLPSLWYGYAAADAIVLDTGDRAVLDALRTKGKALEEWVKNGGHLVVAVGSNGQQVADPSESVLARMLPALPGAPTKLHDLAALETFAGASSQLEPLSVAPLSAPKQDRWVLAATATAPPIRLVVRGPYGFGRVTVVGLDTAREPFAAWPGRTDFWLKALDLRGHGDPAAVTSAPDAGGAFYRARADDMAAQLHLALENPPGVRLIPFGWVAFFIFVYILLIGPGDYLFLKKVVKRMELTWVTFPLIVVAVSVLAYVAAYAVKGTELRVAKVDAVDVDLSGRPEAATRGTSWLTLFSPENRDYTVTVVPRPLDRAPGEGPPASGRAPAGPEPLMSWFGSPDPVLGGGNRLGLSGASYRYEPDGEARAVAGVRVRIWDTKSFTGRWSGPPEPVVEADLVQSGPERLSGTITNPLRRPLKDAWVIYGHQVYELKTIAPGATVPLDPAQMRVLPHLLEERYTAFRDAASVTGDDHAPPIPLADLVRAVMFREAMGTKGSAAPSAPLRHLDLSGQLALGRPMLVAELDGPAADLGLEGYSRAPKVVQATVLRAVLPLKAESPPEARP
jgi:hypothetical protein